MRHRLVSPVLFALIALVLAALPAGAQAPQSSLNLNAYQCPAGYDRISDCTKLGGVVVAVTQDGQPLAELTSSASEGASLEIMFGAAISLEILAGQPEGTVLEPASLSFDAAEGQNAVTLVFVGQEAPTEAPTEVPTVPAPHSDTNALVVQALLCPVAYDGNNYVRDCPGEAGIAVTVTRDADGFVVSDTTGEAGVVGFQGLGEGTYTIELGVPGDFADFQTVCGTPDGFEPREVTNPNTNLIGVYLAPVEELTCTFFVIPVDARGETEPTKPATDEPTAAPTKRAAGPAPTKSATSEPVAALPSTGAGANAADRSDTVLLLLGAGLVLALAAASAVRRRQA